MTFPHEALIAMALMGLFVGWMMGYAVGTHLGRKQVQR